jgi:hypothetical protein
MRDEEQATQYAQNVHRALNMEEVSEPRHVPASSQ